MTTVRHFRIRPVQAGFGVLVMLLSGAISAHAQNVTGQADQRQRLQYQQAVGQQQLSNQLRDNRINQQLQQRISDDNKRPYAGNSSITGQIRQADKARQQRFEAHQQDLLDSYRSTLKPLPLPVPPSSNGKHR
ncbi:hypothetical protein [Dyella sp. A6]|uniref:hypothetical protein n=1 Tax=Dyella aluminiiresistens TaxID=3069105 RepID=UPI002E76A42E|nr:hypothetical protein [Dyella sp. A6]